MNLSFLIKPINQLLRSRGVELIEIQKDYQYAPAYYSAKFHKKLDIRYVPIFRERAREVMGNRRSLMSFDRLFSIFSILQNKKLHEGNVAFAEVGTYRGGGAHFMAAVANDLGFKNRIYVFDTFEGFPENVSAEKDGGQTAGLFSETSFEDVRDYLSVWPAVSVHKGRIEDTAGVAAAETFSCVHLDVDIYEGTKAGLEFFHPRLRTGGVILVDDYGHTTCPGVVSAVDEFCERNPNVFRLPMLTGQCLLVKTAPSAS